MMQQHLPGWAVLAAALFFIATTAELCRSPPAITEADNEGSYVFQHTDNSTLVLHCDSAVRVEWLKRPGLEKYINVTSGRSGPRYTSTLKMHNPYIEDSGFFYCAETENNCSSEVYVYMNNGMYDFVSPEELETVIGTTDDIIVLNCRTTAPDTVVTLYKDDQQITDFTFDAKRGFIIEHPAVTMSGFHQCRIPDGNKEKTHDIVLKVTPGTQTALQTPVIKAPPNTHFVVGHPFRLECTVHSTKPVTFTWTHYDQDPTGFEDRVGNGGKTKKSVYSVDSATLGHSGVYQCRVSRFSLKSTSNNITINILENKPSVLKVTSEPHVIPVNQSQKVFWKVMVEFYPMIPEVVYFNPHNERVKQSHRINSTFNSVTGESRLLINDVQPSDFGNWTLVAHTDDKTTNTSVKIIVTSAPEVKLIVPSSVKPEGSMETAACDVTAYCLPRLGRKPSPPQLEWQVAHCDRLAPDCQWESLDVQTNITNVAENRLVGKPMVAGSPLASLTSSVWLMCAARCGESVDTDEQLLVVTDLSNRWEFLHIGDSNKPVPVPNKVLEMTVVVNDPFELRCGATKSLYNAPTLTSTPKVAVFDTQTDYSNKIYTEKSKVTEEHAGAYTCSVSDKQGQQENKTFIISVIEEQPITLLNSTVELGKTIEISIEVGKPADVVCNPVAAPMPRIQWQKDGVDINNDSDIILNPTTLHFDFFSNEDQGVYTCLMTRRGETESASVEFFIADPRAKISRIVMSIAAVVIGVLVVASLCLVRRVMRERAKSKERNAAKIALFQKGKVDQISPDLRLDEQAELLPYDLKYEVPREHIHMGRQLGSGAFGRVVKAEVKGLDEHDSEKVSPVAIKMTKSLSDPSHVKNLGSELKIMIHLGKHLNIVNLIGANTERITKGEIWILVEYCRYGDLLSFVQKYRKRFVNQIDPINDSINYSILPLTPNSASLPFSPGVNNNQRSRDRPSQSSTGGDGYLVPNTAMPPIVLADPPKGHSARSSRVASPHDPLSPTDSVAFFADNPGYGKLEAASGSPSPVPQTPLSPFMNPTVNSPSHILLSPISEAPQEQSLEAMPTVTHSPSSPPPYNALNGPATPVSPYVNVGVAQPSPKSPPPYVSQGFVPPSSPQKLSDTEAGTPNYRGSNSYRSGSMGGPYKRVNTDMTTVSSPRPFSPDWRDSDSFRSGAMSGKGIPGLESPFTTTELLCWAWQVAQGMDYLTTRKVLHGDLAARNLLLADGNVIKISDFGLSRDIYKQNYLKQSDDLLPIKWMSIEAIRDRCFSVESDVWAYGITMWELFSLGMAPYPGIDVCPEFLKSLENGMRNERPKFSNKEIYKVMCDCWHEDPECRPSFATIMERLRPMVPREVLENFDTMNENYLRMNREYFEKRTDYLNMFLTPDFNNLQKPELDPQFGYMDFQALSEEERCRRNIEYQKMMSSTSGPPEDVSGYLPMSVMGEQPPPDTNGIFSPNPLVSPSDAKRFTFHSTEDLVPPTEVPSSPSYPSNSPTIYSLVPQNPHETDTMKEESYPSTCDDAQERNSFLQSEEADESDSEGHSIANPHYRNYRV